MFYYYVVICVLNRWHYIVFVFLYIYVYRYLAVMLFLRIKVLPIFFFLICMCGCLLLNVFNEIIVWNFYSRIRDFNSSNFECLDFEEGLMRCFECSMLCGLNFTGEIYTLLIVDAFISKIKLHHFYWPKECNACFSLLTKNQWGWLKNTWIIQFKF